MRTIWQNKAHEIDCSTPGKTSLAQLAPNILAECIKALNDLTDFEAVMIKNSIVEGASPREAIRKMWNLTISHGGRPSHGLTTLSVVFAAEAFVHNNIFGFLANVPLELLTTPTSEGGINVKDETNNMGGNPKDTAVETSADGTVFRKETPDDVKPVLNRPVEIPPSS